MTMSGVRGSPFGGRPGRLNIVPIVGPEKISPMPAMLFMGGEALSSAATAFAVWLESLSQSSDTSSSVGPIWPPEGDSEGGSIASVMVAGDWPAVRSPLMRRSRPGSIGDWPCLALMTTRVESRSEEHTSELQSQSNLVCRLLLEKKKKKTSH